MSWRRRWQNSNLNGRIPVQKLLDHAAHYQAEVNRRLDARMPKFHGNYWWNAAPHMKVDMKPTRMGFGQSLAAKGDDERVVCLGLDFPDRSLSATSTRTSRSARNAG